MRKLVLLLLFTPGIRQAFSQWNNNPTINNLVANTSGYEADPLCVTDGANGSIIIFNINDDIYAQKITSAGTIAWGSTSTPVAVCNAAGEQYFDAAIADGSGGAYIVWEDYGNDPDFGEIYIQHINSDGTALWPVNGIRVTNTGDNDDYDASVCGDGNGGVIIAWDWDNYVDNAQVSAQRYNSAGAAQWVANGVHVSAAPGFRGGSSVVTDGAAGAILFFLDTRDDPNGTDYDYIYNNDLENINIYAQRLNGNGTLMWTNDGSVVCNAPGNQYNYGNGDNAAVTDGNGGAIIAFDDERNSVPDTDGYPTNNDIYAQKLNSSGITQWAANGIPVITANGNQYIETSVSDGTGGIVTAWYNEDDDVEFTQKINSTGTANWDVSGITINSSQPYSVRIISDGMGNYIYCFLLNNNGIETVYAQKIDGTGTLQWGGGAPVGINSAGAAGANPTIVLSDNGSAIMSWSNNRNDSTGNDIFASKILPNGVLAGSSSSVFISIANGNWNDPNTWEGGLIPPATAEVTVRHTVTVTAGTSCYSLNVEQPAGHIIVKTGVNFIITH